MSGPFMNDDRRSDVGGYPNPATERAETDVAAFREEISAYFQARRARLDVVATTRTARGQVVDWIPAASQVAGGVLAEPPPALEDPVRRAGDDRPEEPALAELEAEGAEVGPEGSVPVLRKKLDGLSYTLPLRQYLAKYRGRVVMDLRGHPVLVPGPGGRGTHWHGKTSQRTICFGGAGEFSCFDPYTASSDEFSLVQIALSNRDLGHVQTVEAGWQEYRDITGDWLPHLFVYYTTNGYAKDADKQGGYNTDVDGWVQWDDRIFPGTTFTPYSRTDGEQRKIRLRYRLFRGNWWLACQRRWVGYYPASLFMGSQSVFASLGNLAERISFYGEVASFESTPTPTDMGSGRFAAEGWRRSAYFHNLEVQVNQDGRMDDFDGSADTWASDDKLYSIDAHPLSGTSWGSYAWVGGPGAT
jgi:hypothetical protein